MPCFVVEQGLILTIHGGSPIFITESSSYCRWFISCRRGEVTQSNSTIGVDFGFDYTLLKTCRRTLCRSCCRIRVRRESRGKDLCPGHPGQRRRTGGIRFYRRECEDGIRLWLDCRWCNCFIGWRWHRRSSA